MNQTSFASSLTAQLGLWWPVLLGLLVLYVPTYYDLANAIWNTEEQAHGPIVLIVALYLIWTKRHIFIPAGGGAAVDVRPRPVLGWSLLALGLLLYALVRSQEILLFEVGSRRSQCCWGPC